MAKKAKQPPGENDKQPEKKKDPYAVKDNINFKFLVGKQDDLRKNIEEKARKDGKLPAVICRDIVEAYFEEKPAEPEPLDAIRAELAEVRELLRGQPSRRHEPSGEDSDVRAELAKISSILEEFVRIHENPPPDVASLDSRRIFAVAKALNMNSKAIVRICELAGIPAKDSALYTFPEGDLERLIEFLQGK